jgi:hypothetical protein
MVGPAAAVVLPRGATTFLTVGVRMGGALGSLSLRFLTEASFSIKLRHPSHPHKQLGGAPSQSQTQTRASCCPSLYFYKTFSRQNFKLLFDGLMTALLDFLGTLHSQTPGNSRCDERCLPRWTPLRRAGALQPTWSAASASVNSYRRRFLMMTSCHQKSVQLVQAG